MTFPEQVHYSRTDAQAGWKIQDWDTANKLLSYLDPERRHYAIFELPDHSYAQCLGAKKALTVEVREFLPDGTFNHWVFGKGPITGDEILVGGSLGKVSVDKSQVLTMRDARIIIRQFLEARTFPEKYEKQNVNERFK
jgi:hypothetical protein